MVSAMGRGWWLPGLRRAPLVTTARVARPEGPLVWLHATSAVSSSGLWEYARRLTQDDGVSVLMTGAWPAEVAMGGGAGGRTAQVLSDTLPPDSAREVGAFLDHWRPDALLLSEGEVRPFLMGECAARQIDCVVVDGRAPGFAKGCDSWMPGALRRAYQGVSKVYALDTAAGRAFRKLGLSEGVVEVTGRIEEASHALPCLEAEREYLAKLMVARPVWFAAAVPLSEERAVLAAQEHVMQMAHRMLLILMPQDPARTDDLARALAADGWNVAVRNDEAEPTPDTEIYLVSEAVELGLWYRLAPVTYLAGGLSGLGLSLNPLAPAALGSAVLHGPRPGNYGLPLGRLGAARAVRAVASPADLRDALADLLAPDRTARLAQAAWSVVSEGAELSARILISLRATLARRHPKKET